MMTLFIRALQTIALSFVALVALPVEAHVGPEPHPVMSQFNQLKSEVSRTQASITALEQETQQMNDRLDGLPSPSIDREELTRLVVSMVGELPRPQSVGLSPVKTTILITIGGFLGAFLAWLALRRDAKWRRRRQARKNQRT